MTKNIIDKVEYREWAVNSYEEYASETVGPTGFRERLRFMVNHLDQYKVTIDGYVLYEGHSFTLAKQAYDTQDYVGEGE